MTNHGDEPATLGELREAFIASLGQLDPPPSDPAGIADQLDRELLSRIRGIGDLPADAVDAPGKLRDEYERIVKQARAVLPTILNNYNAASWTVAEAGGHGQSWESDEDRQDADRRCNRITELDRALRVVWDELAVFDAAARIRDQQATSAPRGLKAQTRVARALVDKLEKLGIPGSESINGAHALAARWAWAYLRLEGDPTSAIRVVHRKKDPIESPSHLSAWTSQFSAPMQGAE